MHPIPESIENQGLFSPYRVENTNVPISGYLFSLDSGPSIYRYHPETGEPIFCREDKPHWRIDVCAALPEDASGKGGAKR